MQFPGAEIPQPSWAAGRYYFVPPTLAISTSNTQQNGTIRFIPFWVPNQVAITRIGSEITGAGEAGSLLRLGIYADRDARPGKLVLDAGTIDGTSATVQEISLGSAVTLGPAWFWLAACVQLAPTTQPTIRVATQAFNPSIDCRVQPVANYTNCGFSFGGVTSGALPANMTSFSGGTTSIARTFIKL